MRRWAAHIFAHGLVLILKGTKIKWHRLWTPTNCPARVQGCRRRPCWLGSCFYDPWREIRAQGWSGGRHLSAVKLPLWVWGCCWLGDDSDRCCHLRSAPDAQDDELGRQHLLKSWNDMNNHSSEQETSFRWRQWVWRWITFFWLARLPGMLAIKVFPLVCSLTVSAALCMLPVLHALQFTEADLHCWLWSSYAACTRVCGRSRALGPPHSPRNRNNNKQLTQARSNFHHNHRIVGEPHRKHATGRMAASQTTCARWRPFRFSPRFCLQKLAHWCLSWSMCSCKPTEGHRRDEQDLHFTEMCQSGGSRKKNSDPSQVMFKRWLPTPI